MKTASLKSKGGFIFNTTTKRYEWDNNLVNNTELVSLYSDDIWYIFSHKVIRKSNNDSPFGEPGAQPYSSIADIFSTEGADYLLFFDRDNIFANSANFTQLYNPDYYTFTIYKQPNFSGPPNVHDAYDLVRQYCQVQSAHLNRLKFSPAYIDEEKIVFKANTQLVRTVDNAPNQPPPESEIITDADYVIIEYIWAPAAGTDLDTRTQIQSASGMVHPVVGWHRASNDGAVLLWNNDNTGSGREGILVNIKEYAKSNLKQLAVSLRAFWFSTRGTGDVTLKATAYKGGNMVANSFGWDNYGGTIVSTTMASINVVTRLSTDIDGEYVGSFYYDLETKTGKLVTGGSGSNPGNGGVDPNPGNGDGGSGNEGEKYWTTLKTTAPWQKVKVYSVTNFDILINGQTYRAEYDHIRLVYSLTFTDEMIDNYHSAATMAISPVNGTTFGTTAILGNIVGSQNKFDYTKDVTGGYSYISELYHLTNVQTALIVDPSLQTSAFTAPEINGYTFNIPAVVVNETGPIEVIKTPTMGIAYSIQPFAVYAGETWGWMPSKLLPDNTYISQPETDGRSWGDTNSINHDFNTEPYLKIKPLNNGTSLNMLKIVGDVNKWGDVKFEYNPDLVTDYLKFKGLIPINYTNVSNDAVLAIYPRPLGTGNAPNIISGSLVQRTYVTLRVLGSDPTYGAPSFTSFSDFVVTGYVDGFMTEVPAEFNSQYYFFSINWTPAVRACADNFGWIKIRPKNDTDVFGLTYMSGRLTDWGGYYFDCNLIDPSTTQQLRDLRGGDPATLALEFVGTHDSSNPPNLLNGDYRHRT